MNPFNDTNDTIDIAVIPVAGRGERLYPLNRCSPKAFLPFPGSDGKLRPLVHHLVLRAQRAGIKRVGLVVDAAWGDSIRRYFDADSAGDGCRSGFEDLRDELRALAAMVEFIEQSQPRGLGDAVLCGRDFVGESAFMVVLGDYIFPDGVAGRCPMQTMLDSWRQLVAKARDGGTGGGNPLRSLVGVQQVDSSALATCGIVAGQPVAGADGFYSVERVAEKPDVDFARKNLAIATVGDASAGAAADSYLAHFGLYCFDAGIFDCLGQLASAKLDLGEELSLTDAQQEFLATGGGHFARLLNSAALDGGNHSDYINAWRWYCSGGGRL